MSFVGAVVLLLLYRMFVGRRVARPVDCLNKALFSW